METTKMCNCNMYQAKGYCWHTGYKPRFKYEYRFYPLEKAILRIFRWLERYERKKYE